MTFPSRYRDQCAAVLSAWVVTVSACAPVPPIGAADNTPETPEAIVQTHVAHASDRGPLDVVVLFDDSDAARGFWPGWNDLLRGVAAGIASERPRSVHAVVLPTSSGRLQPDVRTTACLQPGTTSFLSERLCGAVNNTAGELGGALSCLAAFEPTSATSSAPLAVLAEALRSSDAIGTGFLRSEGSLLVLVLAIQDDASADASGVPLSVADVRDLALLAHADASRTSLAVVGPAHCDGTASRPTAPRLAAWADRESWTRSNGYWGLCEAPAVLQAELQRLVNPPVFDDGLVCLSRVRDLDPAQPGLQPEVRVFETDVPEVQDGEDTTPPRQGLVPACDGSMVPCWRIEHGPCGAGWELSLARDPSRCGVYEILDVSYLSCASDDDPACALP